jgi:hypothetical protein
MARGVTLRVELLRDRLVTESRTLGGLRIWSMSVRACGPRKRMKVDPSDEPL